jgi:hypothetical protein
MQLINYFSNIALRYIDFSKKFISNYAGQIVEEIHMHGYLEMATVLLMVLYNNVNLNEDKETLKNDTDKINDLFCEIKKAFDKLASLKLIERLPSLESSSLNGHTNGHSTEQNGHSNENGLKKTNSTHKVPKFIPIEKYEKFSVPHLSIKDSQKQQVCQSDNFEAALTDLKKLNEVCFCMYII